jgi:arylsulfatase A-like enzyme
VLGAVGVLVSGGCRAGAEPLLVVVVSLDTTRPDHLSACGYSRPTTPTLERLAREGALFTEARSSTSWTLPAHMSLFTGLPAGLHGVVTDLDVLDRGRRTLGEIFSAAGFRTEGLYTAPYVHPRFGFGRGFDLYESAAREPMLWDLTPEQMRQQVGATEHQSHREVTSEVLVDRALWLLGQDVPRRLLFLHFFDPHYDYRAPRRLVQRFADPAYAGPITGDGVTDDPAIHSGMPAADLSQLQALYDAELAFVDENLARLVAAIEAQGLAQRTVLVVTGDHGEEFFEHGAFGHRAGLHDEVLRVPLLVWAPGRVPAGRRVDTEVALYDVLPTLMDYAGIPPGEDLWGSSLRPLIDGGPGAGDLARRLTDRGVAAALSYFPREDKGTYVLHTALVRDGLKAIETVSVRWADASASDPAAAADESSRRRQVYDLRSDPGEQHDLLAAGDPRAASALQAFERDTERQADALRRFRPQGDDAPPWPLDLRETLQALGYAGTR